MSKFLRSLVRSEGKSCDGKISFPREDSAIRSAEDMGRKKLRVASQAEADLAALEGRPVKAIVPEVFEHYKCDFCDGWHIGHRTNFDWIPRSHTAHRLMLNKYRCPCGFVWITNTVFSTRIITHFPNVMDEDEQCLKCPKCKATEGSELVERRWKNLEDMDPDTVMPIEELWKLSGWN